MEQITSSNSRVVVELPFHGTTMTLESGWIAKQADGAVIVRAGDTMVLCTVCTAAPRAGQSFFPLAVEYQEKAYAAGKIPGGFFKREGRPAEIEILTSRLIDRPIRPLWHEDFMDEVQILCTVLSADGVNSPDTLAICGASAALHISSLPFQGPVAGVRVGRIDGKLVINPSKKQLETSDIDIIIAGTKDAIVMVEGGADVVPESEILEALYFGHNELKKITELQEQLRSKLGKPKSEFVPQPRNEKLDARVDELALSGFQRALSTTVKSERSAALREVDELTQAALAEEFPEARAEIASVLEERRRDVARKMIVNDRKRIDGRGLADVRPIEVEVGIIPRAHGSALFTRGETQAIVTTTLGTSVDSQMVDGLTERSEKTFMLHYNFPPYSTGEVKMLRGTGRRDVGHGALAERSVRRVLPDQKQFPYVIRIVSDVTESNGSSSMASVCGASLSLMDAGAPIKDAVGGVAMGLVKEGEKFAVLTDILGDEDHYGDMDFKVCGTKDGITGLQMDIKCDGLAQETMAQALEQARVARLHILNEMTKAITQPRASLSQFAPQIQTLKINPDKIRDIIGPGGKTIRSITDSTGVKIDIADDGTVTIASVDGDSAARAIEIIQGLTEEAEIGRVYSGIVKRVADFGAFVEILPGIEGLVHISQLADERVAQVTDIVKEGDPVQVRVLDIDRQGRIRLSRKEALEAGHN